MVRRPIRIETHFPRDPKRSLSRLPWRAVALSLATLVLSGTAAAQPHDLATPADSPLWWTLTDQVTPAELKALHSDRSLSLARYQAAVQVGLEAPMDRTQESCLEFYLHPELTPELEPMWLAFRTFYTFHTPGEHARPEYVAAAPEALEGHGISPAGVNVILSRAMETAAEVDSLMAVLGPRQDHLSQLLIDAYADPEGSESLPPQAQVYDAVLQRDYETVAGVVGRPVSEIRDRVDSHADWNATYALVAEALPVLKSDLTEADWQAFRQYLLSRIVSHKGAIKHSGPPCLERDGGFQITKVPLVVLTETETRFGFAVDAEAEWVGDLSTSDRNRFFQTLWWLSHGLGWCKNSGVPAEECQAAGLPFLRPFNQSSVIRCTHLNGCAAHKTIDKPSCQSDGRLYSGRAEVFLNHTGHPLEHRKYSEEGPLPILCADHYSVTATVHRSEPFGLLTLTLTANEGPGTPMGLVETWPVSGGSPTSTVTFEDHLVDGASFEVEGHSSDPDEVCQPASGTIDGDNVEVVVHCQDPNAPPPPPPPPPNHYPVTVEVIQSSPMDSVSLRLEATDGAGGPLAFIESRQLPADTELLTFNTPLPDGAEFAIFGVSSDPTETCEPAWERIRGGPQQVPMFCYDFIVPPPSTEWPGLCDILPSFCRDCHTSTVAYEEIPCPSGYGLVPPCYKLVVRDMCFDIGGFFNTATWQMTLPHTNGGPIQDIDDSLPLVVSANHPEGILGMRVILDGQVIANYPASGSPTTFDLPISSLDTSALAEGAHLIGVYAVTDAPSGPVAVGRTMEFIVDHQGGGGGGGNDTTPPQVSIDEPDNGEILAAGTVVVRALATDASGISKVEFYRNGINQGVRHTDTSHPYEWNWEAVPGEHALDVKAYDASPNQNPAFATRHYVTVGEVQCGDPTPPTVAMSGPPANSTHTSGSVIRLSASAADDVAVTKVEFFVGSTKVGTDTAAPYFFDWTSSGTGSKVITAKAYDACNSTVSAPRTITLVNNPCSNPPPPPTVSLTAPANGSTHTTGVPLTISANASAGVTKVEFYRSTSPNLIGTDTAPPYSVNWTPGGTGSVTLTAKAYDGCSTTTSAGRTITLVSNPCAGDTTGPTVAVTWPPAGSLPASEAWEMRASATDPSGVDLVEFFVNGWSAGTDDDGSPWEVDWSPLPQPGSYAVQARAVDGCNNEKFSPTVNVTLTTGPNPDPPQGP